MFTAARDTETRLLADVEREIAAHPLLADAEIHVYEHSGTVVLAGTVDCYAKRLAAEACGGRIYGVREIQNDLKIEVSGMNSVRDFELTHQAITTLHWHHLFRRRVRFEVSTHLHVVRIAGTVGTAFERAEAE